MTASDRDSTRGWRCSRRRRRRPTWGAWVGCVDWKAFRPISARRSKRRSDTSKNRRPLMTTIAPMTFVTFLAWASLGFSEESSSASQPRTQGLKEELRQAGKHVGNAARVAAERTKEGLRTAGEKTKEGLRTAGEKTKEGLQTAGDKIGTTATKTGKKLERVGKSAKKTTKKVVKDVKEGVGGTPESTPP